jgi:hypothetical protein
MTDSRSDRISIKAGWEAGIGRRFTALQGTIDLSQLRKPVRAAAAGQVADQGREGLVF